MTDVRIAQAHDTLDRAKAEDREAERWLRVATVCRKLDVRPRTVRRWIESGRLQVGRDARQLPGGHWRIREASVISSSPAE